MEVGKLFGGEHPITSYFSSWAFSLQVYISEWEPATLFSAVGIGVPVDSVEALLASEWCCLIAWWWFIGRGIIEGDGGHKVFQHCVMVSGLQQLQLAIGGARSHQGDLEGVQW